jgi:hypothetical protein
VQTARGAVRRRPRPDAIPRASSRRASRATTPTSSTTFITTCRFYRAPGSHAWHGRFQPISATPSTRSLRLRSRWPMHSRPTGFAAKSG